MIGVFVLVVIGVLLGAEIAVLRLLPSHMAASQPSGRVAVGAHRWPLWEGLGMGLRATLLALPARCGDRLADRGATGTATGKPKIHDAVVGAS